MKMPLHKKFSIVAATGRSIHHVWGRYVIFFALDASCQFASRGCNELNGAQQAVHVQKRHISLQRFLRLSGMASALRSTADGACTRADAL